MRRRSSGARLPRAAPQPHTCSCLQCTHSAPDRERIRGGRGAMQCILHGTRAEGGGFRHVQALVRLSSAAGHDLDALNTPCMGTQTSHLGGKEGKLRACYAAPENSYTSPRLKSFPSPNRHPGTRTTPPRAWRPPAASPSAPSSSTTSTSTSSTGRGGRSSQSPIPTGTPAAFPV